MATPKAATAKRHQPAVNALAQGAVRTPAEAAAVLRADLRSGRYEEALVAARHLRQLAAAERQLVVESLVLEADALRALGRTPDAVALLEAEQGTSSDPALALALGASLLEAGHSRQARPVLMTLVSAYNSGALSEQDARALTSLGEAARLLRSVEDANDAFDLAEAAGGQSRALLLARARLFFENHNTRDATTVLEELLSSAPDDPDALLLLARVQLADALDFDGAQRLVGAALAVNPHATDAFAVLARMALHDGRFERAEEAIAQGLETNPKQLELLSLRAAAALLRGDSTGFAAAERAVLSLNPEYAQFYEHVATFAEWEHRYQQLVELSDKALAIDPENGAAFATRGLNLIRVGDDVRGVLALRSAFDIDPYNVRVYNTLELFEKVIPTHYTSTSSGHFKLRYPALEQPLLERYVPKLLAEGFATFSRRHNFVPETPIGVELYSDRSHFAVRTSGLPRTAISGVCFGRTLATMTPRDEHFNLPLTLWHELAHVFHIQKSKSRVPRWFTEGLAEYESELLDAEWKRELDMELYVALRDHHLPRVEAMNEAFTHARDVGDVSVAYYAAYKLVRMLGQRYGLPSISRMLELWGEGHPTPAVFRQALGRTPKQIDDEFRGLLTAELSPYAGQFVPDQRTDDPAAIERAALDQHPPADALARWAWLLLGQGKLAKAKAAAARAVAANTPQALWVDGQVALAGRDFARAVRRATALQTQGSDGYAAAVLLARAKAGARDQAGARSAWQRAHYFDPVASAPLTALVHDAAVRADSDAELEYLRKLAALDEHDGRLALRLSQLLLAAGNARDARAAAQNAVWADIENAATHEHLATLLAAAGDKAAAMDEWKSAAACPGPADARRRALLALALIAEGQGRPAEASRWREEAKAVLPHPGDETSVTVPEAKKAGPNGP